MSKIATQIPRLLSASSRRAFSSTPQRMDAGPERVSLEKIKQLQKEFQLDDGIPVYLKGGLKDRVMFGFTIGLCVFGLGYGATVIYKLAVPPTN